MSIKLIDVAKKAGVSKSTVSQYLNGRYEYMSDNTRTKINKVVEELNYKPNSVARSLKVKKTNTIGVIVSDIQMAFFTIASRGIDDYCRSRNYNVILCNTDNDSKREIEYIDMLKMKQVDGIIIAYSGINNGFLEKYLEHGIPTVIMDRDVETLSVPTVVSENEKGAYMGVKHLIDIGYEDIAFISLEIKGIPSRMKRLEGYKEALLDNGLKYDESKVHCFKTGEEENGLKELLDEGRLPRAVFSINATMSIIFLEFCRKYKVRIPEDVALVGFDDIPFANLLETPITVIKQQVYDIGNRSAEIVINQIENGEFPKHIKERFPCELIVRKSCGYKHKDL